MRKKRKKQQWYSYPLLINPKLSKYSGAYTSKIISDHKIGEWLKTPKYNEVLKDFVN